MRPARRTLTLILAALCLAPGPAAAAWGLLAGGGFGAPADGQPGPAATAGLLVRDGMGSLRLRFDAARFGIGAPAQVEATGTVATASVSPALHSGNPGARLEGWLGPSLGVGWESRRARYGDGEAGAYALFLVAGAQAGAALRLGESWRLGPELVGMWTGVRRQCVDGAVRRCDGRAPSEPFVLFASVALTWARP